MTDATFRQLVRDMRASQREFVSERTSEALYESRRLEDLVDAALRENEHQKTLFLDSEEIAT